MWILGPDGKAIVTLNDLGDTLIWADGMIRTYESRQWQFKKFEVTKIGLMYRAGIVFEPEQLDLFHG